MNKGCYRCHLWDRWLHSAVDSSRSQRIPLKDARQEPSRPHDTHLVYTGKLHVDLH